MNWKCGPQTLCKHLADFLTYKTFSKVQITVLNYILWKVHFRVSKLIYWPFVAFTIDILARAMKTLIEHKYCLIEIRYKRRKIHTSILIQQLC